MSCLWRGTVTLLFVLSLAAPARAANFTVNPLQVSLSPSARSGLVTIKNTSNDELRFQISAFEWDQDDRGEIKLNSTTSLIVFPQLLTLPPGAQRQIRVGTDTIATGSELSYRVFFEELPASKAATANGVQMRTRVGLPVFVRPAGALNAAIQIHDLRAVDSKIAVEVRNTGKAHTSVDSVKIVGLDASGKTIYTNDVAGWYVLANRSTTYEVPVTGAGCSAVSFSASVVDAGKTITDKWSGTVPGCK
jgi:fimbrial chaperone protein